MTSSWRAPPCADIQVRYLSSFPDARLEFVAPRGVGVLDARQGAGPDHSPRLSSLESSP